MTIDPRLRVSDSMNSESLMFDHVGRGHGRRRSFPAFLLALGLNGGAFGSLALLTRHVAEAVTEEVQAPAEQFVEIALPKPPAPAPSGGGGQPKARRAPVTAPSTLVPVRALADQPALALDPPMLDPGAGAGPGPGTGPGVGPETGPGNGQNAGGDGGFTTVHWSEVNVRRRVLPDFPDAARAAGIREATCVVLFRIDGEGVPVVVTPQACPAAFAPSAVAAALKWRFEPLPGHAPAKFALTLQYRTR